MWKAVVVVVCLGLTMEAFANPPKQSKLSAKALQFFSQIEDTNFDAYLKRVRLPKVNAEFKAQVLAQLATADIVKPSEKMQAKLAALTPILQYHERAAVLEIKVIQAREAFVSFQGRSVLLISENMLRLLSVEELQAVVAHELGHEYFWGELMEARQQKQHAMMREIELRCDGIAVIALQRLGIEAIKMTAAITKIIAFNARIITTDPLYHPLLSERIDFIRAMSELVQARVAVTSHASAKSQFTAIDSCPRSAACMSERLLANI